MEFNDKIPIYYQIKQYVYQQIITNKFPPGTKIPAVRQLALDLSVNVNTIQHALSDLLSDGILISQRGRGNFVTDDPEMLKNLRYEVVESHLSEMYEALSSLKISDEEILKDLTTYIEKRKGE